VENAVPVGLQHFRVDEETRVPQLRNLLGQQLHPIDRITEDDGLVDLQLGGEVKI
jgi:hypothetical protein